MLLQIAKIKTWTMSRMKNFLTLTVIFIQGNLVYTLTNSYQDEMMERFERLYAKQNQDMMILKLKLESVQEEVQILRRLKSDVEGLKLENEILQDSLNNQNGFNIDHISETVPWNKTAKRLIGGDIIPDLVTSATAFSAVLSQNVDRNIGKLHTFVYDHVESNFGGAYNNNSGLFTAPKPGIYAFLWTIVAEGRTSGTSNYGEIITELVVNSMVRGQAFTDTEVDSDDDQATGFVIVQLKQGDVVYVRSSNKWNPQGVFQRLNHGGWTFSGWQIA